MEKRPINEAPSFIHEKHPRKDGVWPQYFGMGTRLRGRVYFSDLISPDDRWETYDGKQSEVVNLADQTPENYHQTHNHYQTLLAEVWNFSPHTNAIPIWGDGAALVSGSSAWGAFASARSAYLNLETNENTHIARAVPPGTKQGPREEFDAQLCGLEVDVLNDGKPGVYPNKAKHGIQIVGFGKPNSHAVSVICENFDCAPEMRKGQFESGLYFQNSVHPDYGRLMVADFTHSYMGLDFRKSIFSWGLLQANAPRPGTGIVFSEGRGGEIYSGPREGGGGDCLTIRVGFGGFRLLSYDGSKEIFRVDADGNISFSGSVIINGRKLELAVERVNERKQFLKRAISFLCELFGMPSHA